MKFDLFLLYYLRERGGEVSSRLGWLFWPNRNQGEYFIMQLSCFLCLPSRWVGSCVPGVIEGSKDAALVWTKGEPRGISYWAVSHLESCQAYTMELLCENSQRPQQVDYISKKGSITHVWLDSKCTPDWRCCKCGVKVNWKCAHGRSCDARSDYKKSYFWWCKNIVCGDSTGSN